MGVTFQEGALGCLDQSVDMVKPVQCRTGKPQPIKQAKDHQRCHTLGRRDHVENGTGRKLDRERRHDFGVVGFKIGKAKRASDRLKPARIGSGDITAIKIIKTNTTKMF